MARLSGALGNWWLRRVVCVWGRRPLWGEIVFGADRKTGGVKRQASDRREKGCMTAVPRAVSAGPLQPREPAGHGPSKEGELDARDRSA